MGWVCSHKFRYIHGPRFKAGVRSKEVEVHFVNLLALEGFVKACWYTFCASIAWFGNHKLRYILWPRWHGMGLFNTSWDTICSLADMGVFWSTHVEIHFVNSLAWFGQHNLRYIFCIRWHWSGLDNTISDIFSVLARKEWMRWTHVETHFVSLQAWKGYCKYMSRYILYLAGNG